MYGGRYDFDLQLSSFRHALRSTILSYCLYYLQPDSELEARDA